MNEYTAYCLDIATCLSEQRERLEIVSEMEDQGTFALDAVSIAINWARQVAEKHQQRVDLGYKVVKDINTEAGRSMFALSTKEENA